jgi:hypothetical protein
MGCIELKPCPDCGREPKVQEAQGAYCYEWRIICYRCCNMSAVCNIYREAIESWNSMVTARPDEGDDLDLLERARIADAEQYGGGLPRYVVMADFARAELAAERTRRIKAETAVKAIDNYWESGNFTRDPKLWKMLKSALQEAKDD